MSSQHMKYVRGWGGGAHSVRSKVAGMRVRTVTCITLCRVYKLRLPGAVPALLHTWCVYYLRTETTLSEPYALIQDCTIICTNLTLR